MPELFLVREQDVAHFASFRALRSILAPDLFKMPKKCLMGCTNKPPCVSLCLRHHQMGDKMDSLSLVLSPRAPPGPRAMHIRTSVHPPPDGGKRLIRQSLPAPRAPLPRPRRRWERAGGTFGCCRRCNCILSAIERARFEIA